MDFDEYDYLEKAVEEPDDRELKKTKKDASEKNGKSLRKREVEEEEAASGGREDDELRVKRSKGEYENGKEDRDRSDRGKDRHRRDRDEDADLGKERDRERHRTRERGSSEKERDREKDREKERDRDRDREKEKERDRDRDREKERDRERHKDKERERDRDKERRDKEREREKEKEKEKERDRREREKREREREKEREVEEERSRRSRSRSVREREREREREIDVRESRRMKEKKDVVEPEADPERDQRTVFAYQMPLKATERDVYEFFSKAGKVRDVRLIMDRNSRRSKGVGYVEFYDAMSVPMAIAISGQLLLGQPVMVKPSEAEKNLVQSNASGGATGAGPYGAIDRKLYVGNLHFNMTETHLREIFEAFGPVELVQLPLDLESGHCKGFGFVQFAHLEHSKAALSLNGKLEIAGRTIKVSSVTDHIGVQESVAKSNDLDDDEGGGLALNAQSRALLMQKLDRTGIATSIAGSLGAPVLNGSATSLPLNGQVAVSAPVIPANFTPPALQSVGSPSECLLLKNMFDPATETEPDFDVEIKEDVEEECSKYGRVKHIYVDKNSAGCVYMQYETVEAAVNAQRAMHTRWFAGRQISVLFMQPQVYEAKFNGA